MTWIKICGMTNLEDALVAVEAGADAVGFVFYEKSSRNVSAKAAGEIVSQLPKNTEVVGIFVKDSASGVAAMKRIVHQAGLTAIQVYGYGSRASVRELSLIANRLILSVPANVVFNRRIATLTMHHKINDIVSAILLDAGTEKQHGGTGRKFDWEKAAVVLSQFGNDSKFVVAGGLTPSNVGEAMGILKPWGVDVVSGVEASPGKKDPEKVRAFVRAVREMDARIA